MKKLTALSGAVLMLLSLGACKNAQPPEQNTVPETEISEEASEVHSIPHVETSVNLSDENTVQARSFIITIPASWEGRYTLEEIAHAGIADEGMLRFGSVQNAQAGGHLFSVFATAKKADENIEGINLVNVGILSRENEKKYVYAVYPTDCQYDVDSPERFDEYQRMQRDGYDMFDGIKGTEGWEYTPCEYARHYV